MNDNGYFVYIMASKPNGTIYVGVTDNIERRVREHKTNSIPDSFTARYNVHDLVYYERFDSINYAIVREKQLKSWKRCRKVELISKMNSEWKDLYEWIMR